MVRITALARNECWHDLCEGDVGGRCQAGYAAKAGKSLGRFDPSVLRSDPVNGSL